MPNLDVIRNLTLNYRTQGAAEFASAGDRAAASSAKLAQGANTAVAATERQERATLSAGRALEAYARAHDPVFKATQNVERAQLLVSRAMAQGHAGTPAYAAAMAALARQQAALAGANDNASKSLHGAAAAHEAHGSAVTINANKLAEAHHVFRAVSDEMMAGRSLMGALGTESGRLLDIFGPGAGTIAKFTGALAGISPLVYAGAAAAGFATVSMLSYVTAQDRMAASLEGVGRRAGMTLAQLNGVAEAGSRAAGISLETGQTLAASYAQRGLDEDTSRSLIGASRRYGEITGQGTAEAGAKLGEIFEAPAAGLKELDRTFGLLDGRLQTTVDRMTAAGDLEGARRVAMDAYLKAQAEMTDRTWTLSKAFSDATGSVGNWASGVGHSIAVMFGGGSDADRLAKNQALLAELQRSDPEGKFNGDDIASVRAEIARLQSGMARADEKTRTDAEAARARELSIKVDAGLQSALPELMRVRGLEDRLSLIGRGLNTPGVAADSGFGGADMRTAFDRTAVQLSNADPFRRMVEDAKLATASVEAYTLAERAAVEARRAEIAVLREDGDVRRASLAARIAENAAITEANQRASDRLEQARQDRALVGLSPYERARQQIINQYDGVGGFNDKESATRSELTDAMRPVRDDLAHAGQTIADAMKAAADRITAAVPGGSPFGTLDRSAFAGGSGRVGQPMFALMDRAIAAGATPAVAAGFAAGTSMESGTRLDPTADNGSHLGVAQWDGPRWRALVAKLGGGTMSTQAGQFNGIFAELGSNEAGAGRKLLAGHSVLDGILASDAYERPGDVEAARRRGEALSRGNALLAAYPGAKGGAPGETTALTVVRSRSEAGVPLVASTAAADNKASMGEKLAALNQEQVEGPLKAANTALAARNALLDASTRTLGQNTSAVQAAADAQRLLSQYQAEDPNHALGADRWRTITAGVDAYRESLQRTLEKEDELNRKKAEVVGAMDDVRSAGKSFLSPLVDAAIHGTSAMAALRSGLESVASKIAGRLEDTAIDSLFGRSGTPGGGIFGSGLSSLLGAGQGGGMLANLGGSFSAGGYTGSGGKYEPAGVVHGGEFVFSREAVGRAGVGSLDAMHRSLRGYSDGGYVGPMFTPPPMPQAPNGGSGGSDMPSGDLHVHVYGGSGDAHIRGLVHQGVSSAIAANNRALPGMLADRQRRTD